MSVKSEITTSIQADAIGGDRNPNQCNNHEWIVFSTALTERWLMLQCVICGQHGTVESPSKKEWSTAYTAPSQPYLWTEQSRVTIKDFSTPRCVIRRSGKRCDCYSRFGITEPREYERVPGEITTPAKPLTADERQELEAAAAFVVGSDLCSRFYPLFERSFANSCGHTVSSAVKELLGRIEAIDRKGIHCSPAVLGRLIWDYTENASSAES